MLTPKVSAIDGGLFFHQRGKSAVKVQLSTAPFEAPFTSVDSSTSLQNSRHRAINKSGRTKGGVERHVS